MSTGSRIIGKFGKTRIYLHRKVTKEGRCVDGRYLYVGGVFELGAPLLKSSQFIGIHNHLFITVTYPSYVKDLLGIAADLPATPETGPMTWLGVTGLGVRGKDMDVFISKSIWGFEPGDFEETVRTTSYLRTVTGIAKGQYHLLEVPLITTKFLRDRYRPQCKPRKPRQPRPRKNKTPSAGAIKEV